MVATPTQAPPLRSHLGESLKSLPGSSQLSLYTLITPARKHIGLFPYTSLSQSSPLRSKILQQEFLILVAQSPVEDATQSVFVSGIEAVLYSIPCNSSSILYISKVDSTGQTVAGCGSPTRPLVKALIDYFVSPVTRPTRNMRVQLFARAQNQYLFPDSSLHMEKRVLTDVKLCRWWKDVLTNVLQSQLRGLKGSREGDQAQCKCYYLFPGLSQAEADRMLDYASAGVTAPPIDNTPAWTYSHPYSSPHSTMFSALTFPLSSDSNDITPDIFDLMPTFSDDPKARFLVELAATSNRQEAASSDGLPSKKRMKSEQPSLPSPPAPKSDTARNGDETISSNSTSTPSTFKRAKISVTTEEFWERMGFRQECTLNAVTGFFVVDHLLDASPSPPVNDNASPSEVAARGTVPTAMLARISSSLQNLDFGSTERAIEATKVLTESIKGLCAGLGSGGSGGSEDDFYGEHVPTSMIVRNPPRLMKVTNSNMTQKNGEASGDGVQTPAPVQVNVLQARKKKRPAVTG
ncbi:hypothetical protein FRB96_005490 [Tulasnella sp. 330]|nr:hypothetical protein FRB96_005490 [Tulasnella sp. 330]